MPDSFPGQEPMGQPQKGVLVDDRHASRLVRGSSLYDHRCRGRCVGDHGSLPASAMAVEVDTPSTIVNNPKNRKGPNGHDRD